MNRIVFISTNDWTPWGGSEVLWSSTALRIARLGQIQVSVNVMEWSPMPRHINALKDAGAEIIYKTKSFPSIHQRIANRVLPSKFHFRGTPVWESVLSRQWGLVIFSLG